MLIGTAVAVSLFVAQQLHFIHPSFMIPGPAGDDSQSYMAANFWRALWAWLISAGIAVAVSFFTQEKSDEELTGYVYGLTEKRDDEEKVVIYKKPEIWAIVTLAIFIGINFILW